MLRRILNVSPPGLALAALIANWLVVLDGAVVRATGSGAGCGNHWPSCNGEVIPLSAGVHTLIEFGHRSLTVLVVVLGVWLLARAFTARREKPGFWLFARLAFVFLILEALLGAVTVLFDLTRGNPSLVASLMVPVHLTNSFVFLGVLTLCFVCARADAPWPPRLRSRSLLAAVLGVGLLSMLLLVFSGGIAALGDSLYPTNSLSAGLAQDFSSSHPLIRLRFFHPVVAAAVGIYLFLSLGMSWRSPAPQARRLAQLLFGVYVAQLFIGLANLVTLAPVALQLLHLFTASLAFVLLTALSGFALGEPLQAETARQRGGLPYKEA